MVEKLYYDVNDMTWHTNGHAAQQPAPEAAVPSARQLWREAVAQAAEKARAALPEANGRIDAAVALVLHGDVELLADGSAKVGSQSDAGTVYHVVRECTCQDAPRAPHGGQCKHLIARGIAVRAQQRLEAALAELDAAAVLPPPVPAPVASLPEAPASANAFVVIDGHRVQVTVRGHTLAGVLTEIRTVLKQFPAEAATEAPTPPAAAPEPGPMDRCPLHPHEIMRTHTKGSEQWKSHRLADGTWCRGK